MKKPLHEHHASEMHLPLSHWQRLPRPDLFSRFGWLRLAITTIVLLPLLLFVPIPTLQNSRILWEASLLHRWQPKNPMISETNAGDLKVFMTPTPTMYIQTQETVVTPIPNDELWQPICPGLYGSDFSVVIQQGYGSTHVARDMLEGYFNLVALRKQPNEPYSALTPEEKVYAEDMLVKRADLTGKVGETVVVSCDLVEEVAFTAKKLTSQQKGTLKSYGESVSEFETQEMMRQIVDEAFKDSSIKPQVITIE